MGHCVWINTMGNTMSVTCVWSTCIHTTIPLANDSPWRHYRSTCEYKRAPAIDVINLVWRRRAGEPKAWQWDTVSCSASQGTLVTVFTWDVPFRCGTQHWVWIEAMRNKYPLQHTEGMPASLAIHVHNYNRHSMDLFSQSQKCQSYRAHPKTPRPSNDNIFPRPLPKHIWCASRPFSTFLVGPALGTNGPGAEL